MRPKSDLPKEECVIQEHGKNSVTSCLSKSVISQANPTFRAHIARRDIKREGKIMHSKGYVTYSIQSIVKRRAVSIPHPGTYLSIVLVTYR